MFYSELTGKTYMTELGRNKGESLYGKPLAPNHRVGLERYWEKARKDGLWPRSGFKNTPEHNAAIGRANSHKQSPEHIAKRIAKATETKRLKKLARTALQTNSFT